METVNKLPFPQVSSTSTVTPDWLTPPFHASTDMESTTCACLPEPPDLPPPPFLACLITSDGEQLAAVNYTDSSLEVCLQTSLAISNVSVSDREDTNTPKMSYPIEGGFKPSATVVIAAAAITTTLIILSALMIAWGCCRRRQSSGKILCIHGKRTPHLKCYSGVRGPVSSVARGNTRCKLRPARGLSQSDHNTTAKTGSYGDRKDWMFGGMNNSSTTFGSETRISSTSVSECPIYDIPTPKVPTVPSSAASKIQASNAAVCLPRLPLPPIPQSYFSLVPNYWHGSSSASSVYEEIPLYPYSNSGGSVHVADSVTSCQDPRRKDTSTERANKQISGVDFHRGCHRFGTGPAFLPVDYNTLLHEEARCCGVQSCCPCNRTCCNLHFDAISGDQFKPAFCTMYETDQKQRRQRCTNKGYDNDADCFTLNSNLGTVEKRS